MSERLDGQGEKDLRPSVDASEASVPREQTADDLLEQLRQAEQKVAALAQDDAVREAAERRLFELRAELEGEPDADPKAVLARVTAALEQGTDELRRALPSRYRTHTRFKPLLFAAMAIAPLISGSRVEAQATWAPPESVPQQSTTPPTTEDEALRKALYGSPRRIDSPATINEAKKHNYKESKGRKTDDVTDYELLRRYVALDQATLDQLIQGNAATLTTMLELNADPLIVEEHLRQTGAMRRARLVQQGIPLLVGEIIDARQALNPDERALLQAKVDGIRQHYNTAVKEHGIDSDEAKDWLRLMEPWQMLHDATLPGMRLPFFAVREAVDRLR